MQVHIEDIQVGERARAFDPAHAKRLADSFEGVGQLQPILLEELDDGGYKLIAGLHRLRAAEMLEWHSLDATISDLDGWGVELAEIDENLFRAELSKLERAEHLKARKEIYERLYPETKHGGDRRSSPQLEDLKQPSFASDTASKLGTSRQTVEREVRRAQAITPEVRDAIRATSIADNGSELDALAKASPDQQREAVEAVSTGLAKTVRQALSTRSKTTGALIREIQEQNLRDELEALAGLREREGLLAFFASLAGGEEAKEKGAKKSEEWLRENDLSLRQLSLLGLLDHLTARRIRITDLGMRVHARHQKEVCDGKDDDCDGNIDEASETRVASNEWADEMEAEYIPLEHLMPELRAALSESCDNKDDDCDGPVDEGSATIEEGVAKALETDNGGLLIHLLLANDTRDLTLTMMRQHPQWSLALKLFGWVLENEKHYDDGLLDVASAFAGKGRLGWTQETVKRILERLERIEFLERGRSWGKVRITPWGRPFKDLLAREGSCDGKDNDCDGQVDEAEEKTEEGVPRTILIKEERYTPDPYASVFREILGGIDLDVASCARANQTIQARHYYTRDDNALTRDWDEHKPKTLFFQPPYTRGQIDPFVAHFSDFMWESRYLQQAIGLVNSSTSAAWYQLLLEDAAAICFPKERIEFASPYQDATTGNNQYTQTIFYFCKGGKDLAPRVNNFLRLIAPFGYASALTGPPE